MSRTKWILTSVFAAILLLVPAVVLSQSQKPHQTTVQAPVIVPLDADVIFTKINNERVKNGLKPLVRDARLDATAQQRADDMVARNYFSHFDPIDGHKMIDDQDFQCTGGSENISMTVPGETGDYNINTVNSFMNSKSHRDAILDTRYTLTGVAISKDKIVQHFCITK